MTDPILSRALRFFEEKLQSFPSSPSSIKAAYTTLSHSYRQKESLKKGFKDDGERLAYLLARFPATYSACKDVLEHLPKEDYADYHTVTDLGCGPGTASLACLSLFPSLTHYALIEKDFTMGSLAHDLLKQCDAEPTLTTADLLTAEFPSADLMILSYVLTEFSLKDQIILTEKTWNATKKALLIIIPGTPHFFDHFLTIRGTLLQKGAHLHAPCPHSNSCPMQGTKDWCHFKARTPRTTSHRLMKNSSLPYEDEPYSYLLFTRNSFSQSENRIIRRPLEKKGHIIFDLCTKEGLKRHTFTRSHKNYKDFKKKKLGEDVKAAHFN